MKNMYVVLDRNDKFISFFDAGYGDLYQETPVFTSLKAAKKFLAHLHRYGFSDLAPFIVNLKPY